MSTTKQFTVRKNFPSRFRLRAEGYYDTYYMTRFSSGTTETVSMEPWPVPLLTYTSSEFNPGYVSVDSGDFNDRSARNEDTKILMPYDHGKLYRGVKIPHLNYYLVNQGCTITDGIVSGFSTSNYLKINKPFSPKASDTWELTTKVTTGDNISSTTLIFQSCKGTGSDGRFGVNAFVYDSKFCLDISSNGSSWAVSNSNGNGMGSHTLSTNTTYWVKYGWNGSEYYILISNDGESYEEDLRVASEAVYSSLNYTYLGIYSTSNMQYPWSGSIDLNETKLYLNNEIFFEYPQTTYIDTDMQGCLETASDGTAHTYNCYMVCNTSSREQRLVLSDSAPVEQGSKVYNLNSITIPAHDTYTYTEEESLVPDNVDLIGDLTLDTSTGVVSNFTTNRYCLLPSTYSVADAESFEFQIKFKRTESCSSERIFGLGGVGNHYGVTLAVSGNKTQWWIGSYQSGWNIASGRGGITTLTIGTVFWAKVVFDGSSYKCYISTDGADWTLDYSVDSSTRISPTLSPTLGTAEAPASESIRGEIYLGDCYFKIENNTVWSGMSVNIIGKWTKNT